ncbi:MAG: PD-(D/E)XK nuclease family transposase [Mediterraneibacter faecis]|nr:PD-(D/E)XK nuclease family transposase [Mediterraneibacter faecis]
MRKTRKSVSTKKGISHCKALKETQEDFIMLPTVDFCFKELMQNDNIRKNIIAALLNVPPSEVENTELMPTILRKESKDDKYGILDVRVKLKDGEQIDFEMHILELSKLPPEEKNETSLLQWMRFLGGKNRKDFKEMAKKNSELEEAYDVLDKLSADEKKRLEYETRQRAIRDYNIGMLTAERRGIESGRKIGREEGRAEGETLGVSRINQLILELSKHGRTDDIVKAAADEEYQKKLLEEFDL